MILRVIKFVTPLQAALSRATGSILNSLLLDCCVVAAGPDELARPAAHEATVAADESSAAALARGTKI